MTTNPLRWLLCQRCHIRFQISRPIIFFNCYYIPVKNQPLHGWFSWFLDIITTSIKRQPSELSFVNFWFNEKVLPPASIPPVHFLIVEHTVSYIWHYSLHVYKLTEFGIRLDGTHVAIQISNRDSYISSNNSYTYPTPYLGIKINFGYHHVLANNFDDIISSTKLRTDPLSFPPSSPSLTSHHTLQDPDSQILHPSFTGL